MTEVGIATLNPPSGVIKQGSIGPPIAGFEIEIRDEAGAALGDESVGRIWMRTRSQMSGYWEAPEATRRSSARAGSTRATSPAPTRTATSGSSAARSR